MLQCTPLLRQNTLCIVAVSEVKKDFADISSMNDDSNY